MLKIVGRVAVHDHVSRALGCIHRRRLPPGSLPSPNHRHSVLKGPWSHPGWRSLGLHLLGPLDQSSHKANMVQSLQESTTLRVRFRVALISCLVRQRMLQGQDSAEAEEERSHSNIRDRYEEDLRETEVALQRQDSRCSAPGRPYHVPAGISHSRLHRSGYHSSLGSMYCLLSRQYLGQSASSGHLEAHGEVFSGHRAMSCCFHATGLPREQVH